MNETIGNPKYKIGDMVLISENINHDSGRKRQVGIVHKCAGYIDNDFYYYVVSYDTNAGRYWACGFHQNELESLGGDFIGLIDAYAYWLSTDCWRNTDHSIFIAFTKSLKRIRKKYKTKVKERIGL